MGDSDLDGAHTLLRVPSESWQRPEQHSVSRAQLALASAHDLHAPALQSPEIAPGTAQHWALKVHDVALPTGMHAEHAPFAHDGQSDGHWDERLQDWPHDSAFTHVFTPVSPFSLHRPERQSASCEQLSMGLVIRHVPVGELASLYLQVMPEQHFCVGEHDTLPVQLATVVVMMACAESTGSEHAPYLSHALDCISIPLPWTQPPARSSQLTEVELCQKMVVGVLSYTHLYSILIGVSRSGSEGVLAEPQFWVHIIVSVPFMEVMLSAGMGGALGGLLASHTPSLHARLCPGAQSDEDAQVLPPDGSWSTHVLAPSVPCARLHRPVPFALGQHSELEVQSSAPTGKHALQDAGVPVQ
jgi:hypothetical protein